MNEGAAVRRDLTIDELISLFFEILFELFSPLVYRLVDQLGRLLVLALR